MFERTRLEVQDIATKAARQVFARQNVRVLADEHVRQLVEWEVAARLDQLAVRLAEQIRAEVRRAVAEETSG